MNRKHMYILLIILSLSLVFAGCSRKDMLKSEDRTSSIGEDIPPVVEDIAEEMPENTQMTILAVGDIMFHMPQSRAAYDENTGTYDFKDNFEYVKKYIESADLAIANFET